MSLTQKYTRKARSFHWLKIILGVGILAAILFSIKPYPCQECEGTGSVKAAVGEESCTGCGGDGAHSLGDRLLGR